MKSHTYHRHVQRSSVFVALLLFNLVLLILQLWLFVAVLENAVAGDTKIAVPAAIASVAILLFNLSLFRAAWKMEH